MSKDSKRWLRRHVSDHYVHQSRAAGYRSRAAYKLKEILAKNAILKPAMVVIDLGSAPGGWSQVLRQELGSAGRVIAIDRLAMEEVAGVEFIQGDFSELDTLNTLLQHLESAPVDWIFSDMAPNISGIKAKDQAECQILVELVIDCCHRLLKPGGGLLIKVFQGGDFSAITTDLRRIFQSVRIVKPKASRDASKEVYLLGTGYNS